MFVVVNCIDCNSEIVGDVQLVGRPASTSIECPYCPPMRVWHNDIGELCGTQPYGIYQELGGVK